MEFSCFFQQIQHKTFGKRLAALISENVLPSVTECVLWIHYNAALSKQYPLVGFNKQKNCVKPAIENTRSETGLIIYVLFFTRMTSFNILFRNA